MKNKCRITLRKCNLIKSDFQHVRGFFSLPFYSRWSGVVVLCNKGKLTTRMKCEEISWVLLAKIPLRGWVRELCICACHTNHSVGCIKQRIKLPVRKYDDIFIYLETCQITVCCSVKHVFGLLLFQFNQDRRPAWKLVKTDVASSLNTSNLFKFVSQKKNTLARFACLCLMQLWSNLVFHLNADAVPLFPAAFRNCVSPELPWSCVFVPIALIAALTRRNLGIRNEGALGSWDFWIH